MSGSWKTERCAWFGCELWTGSTNSNGYGTVWTNGRPSMAHYVSFEKSYGPIPHGGAIDHLCRRRLCVASAHLEAVSTAENLRRRSWAYRSKRASCSKGHALSTHGRKTPEAGIICRICSGVWEPEKS